MAISQADTVKETPSAQKEECPHHWIIEQPNGPFSKGYCKICGDIGKFKNAPPEEKKFGEKRGPHARSEHEP